MLSHSIDSSSAIGPEPDWRALRAARHALRAAQRCHMFVMRVSLSTEARDAFYRRAYRDDISPARLLKDFAEAYASGAQIPQSCNAAISASVASGVPAEIYERVRTRAKAEGVSIAATMRAFILAYARNKRS